MNDESTRDEIREICKDYYNNGTFSYSLSTEQFQKLFNLFSKAKQETWDKAIEVTNICTVEVNYEVDAGHEVINALKQAKAKDCEENK